MRDRYGNLISKTEQDTQRALKGRKGPPGEADRPKLSTFPGPKREPLPGQLSFTDSAEPASRG